MSRASAGEIARIGVLVRIPPALRSYTAGEDEVVLDAQMERSIPRSRESGIGLSTRPADDVRM